MSIDPSELGELPPESADIGVIFGEKILDIQPDNTSLHTFDNPQYNHVRHFPGNGQKVRFFQLDEPVIEGMRKRGFRVQHHKEVDTATHSWFLSVVLRP